MSFLKDLFVKKNKSKYYRIEREINKGNNIKAMEIVNDFEKSQIDEKESIKLLIFKSIISNSSENNTEAERFADEAIEKSKSSKDELLHAEAMTAKATALFDQNKLEECEKIVDNCLEIVSRVTDANIENLNEVKARALYLKGRVYRKKRDIQSSIKVYEEALKLRESNENLGGQAEIQGELGILSFMKGEAQSSVDYFLKSIQNYEDIGNKPKLLKIYNNAGMIFQNIGDLSKSLDLYKRSLKITEELELKQSIGTITLNIGNIYADLGELNTALEYLQRSLKVFEENNMIENQPMALNGIATIHEIKGDLQTALDMYNKGLKLSEELEDSLSYALTLHNIGSIYRIQGELDLALENFNRSAEIFDQLQLNFEAAMARSNCINVYVRQEDLKKAEELLKLIKEESDREENPAVNLIYRISRANILKVSRRIIKKAEAQLIFQQVSEEEVVHHETTVDAMFNLCEMLIQELRESGNEAIISEVKETLEKLNEIAQNQNSYKVLVESKLLQSKVALLELDLNLARETLNEAQTIAFEKGLDNLALVISGEYDALLDQLSKWTELIDSNVSMIERLEMAELESMVSKMVRRSADSHAELLEEIPELFILLNDQGMKIYSQVFLKDSTLNDQVVGDLLTATNSFLQETFSTEGSIDRLKHKDHIIMLKPLDNYLCCYVFKGQSYSALQKLEKFIESTKQSKDIYEAIKSTEEELKHPEFNSLVSSVFVGATPQES